MKGWTHLSDQILIWAAVWGVAGAAFILGLPILNGVTAFAATTSIACAGLALTYGVPILLRIINRGSYVEAGPFSLGRCGPSLHLQLLPIIALHLTSSHLLIMHRALIGVQCR